MQRFKRFFLTGALLAAAAWPATGAAARNLAVTPATAPAAATCAAIPAAGTGTVPPAIDRIFSDAIARKISAGFSVAVAQDGKVVFAKGYGESNFERPDPVTVDRIFKVGSITKEFTAAAILRLAEQGKLSIDDPVTKHLPDFPIRTITIRELLNHTAGLRSYTDAEFHLREGRVKRTMAQMIAYILAQDGLETFTPGSQYSYSNSGYYILGAIIERISGRPYDRFVQDEFFGPLGLTHTSVDLDEAIVPGRVRGYDAAPDAPLGFLNTSYNSPSGAGPAGAIQSNAADLLCWQQALLGGKVLTPDSVAQMARPGKGDYGLGLMTRHTDKGVVSVGHIGAINGFHAFLFTYPDRKLTFVILANSLRAIYPIQDDFEARLLEAFPSGK